MAAQAYLVKDALLTFNLPAPNLQLVRNIQLPGIKKHYSFLPVDSSKRSDIALALKVQKIFSDEKNELRKVLQLDLTSRSRSISPNLYATNLDCLQVELRSVIFRNLLVSLGDQMKLQLELKNPEVELASVNPPSPTSTGILTWNDRNGYIFYYGRTDKFPQRWAQYWNRSLQQKFSVQLSITICGNLVLNERPAGMLGSAHHLEDEMECIPKKLLEEKNATNTTIITADGSKVKCHKSFLVAQSAVFQTMLAEGRYKEGESQEIEMADMSEKGVKALLAFLYYKGLEEPSKDPKVALELLRAAIKYDINSLENATTAIIMQKPVDWFDISTTIQLFFFSKNIDQLVVVKLKCLQILKSKSAELTASDDYKQLFEDAYDANRVAARELSTALINM